MLCDNNNHHSYLWNRHPLNNRTTHSKTTARPACAKTTIHNTPINKTRTIN